MSALVSVLIGVAFCVVAWRPPVSGGTTQPTPANPNGLSWGKPRLLPNVTGRVVQALFAVFGVLVLIDGIVGLTR